MDGLQRLQEEMLFLRLEQGVLADLVKSAPPQERDSTLRLLKDLDKKLALVTCAVRRATDRGLPR